MKLITYLRVSTPGQQADGYGLEVQERACKAWAKANGHKIVATYTDVMSGKSEPAERPGLSAALDALRPPPQATGLLVPRLDRLARALHVQEVALQVAWRTGAKVFTADGGEVLEDDPEDPMRTFVRQVMGGVAQLERAMIAKRMRDGRAAKAAAGRKATGDYAYGYRGEGRGRERDAAPHPDEQAAVSRIVELRKAGTPYRAIAAALDAEGLKPRRAASWSAMSVRNVAVRAGVDSKQG